MRRPEKKRERTSPRPRILWIALAASAALSLALVLLLPAIQRAFPAKRYADPPSANHQATLATHEPAALASVTVRHAQGDSYTLRAENGVLKLAGKDGLVSLDETAAQEIADAATTIAIIDTVAVDAAQVEEHLADMGLNPPQAVAQVAFTDGTAYTVEIGAPFSDTTFYYYRWSGDPGVYLCDVGTAEALLLNESRLLPVPRPVLASALVDWITLESSGETWEITFAADETGAITGALSSPYAYPLSAQGAEGLLTALENLRLGTPIDESAAAYSFEEPLAVLVAHQRAGQRAAVDEAGQLTAEALPEQTLRFTFGKAGDAYFYPCLYENGAYHVSRLLAQPLLAAVETRLTRTPANLGNERIASLSFVMGEKKLEIEAVRTERVLPNNQLETDENGNLLYDVSVSQNSLPMTPERFDQLTASLAALTVSGDLPAGWQLAAGNPLWQLTLTAASGQTRTLAAYPLDAFSNALQVNGVFKHYLNAEAIQAAFGDLWPGS